MDVRIEQFNALAEDEAGRVLAGCADVASWVSAIATERPFADRATLLDRADTLARGWTAAEVDVALAHHPRIGERATNADDAAHSSAEQSGVDAGDADLAARLAEGNRRYEERFDRIYLVRAAGRTGAEMLDLLEQRLTNDDETEAGVTAGELREIALLRLGGAVD